MKKVVLTFGLIAGTIVAAMILISIPLWENGMVNFSNGELVGYTSMVIALSVIFVAIKTYRDKYQGGKITFWAGFKIGILITLIASVMYALAWEVSYNTMGDHFTQQMLDHYVAEKKASGATEEELVKMKQEWDTFREYYKNPLIRFPLTLTEIFPVGLIISLVAAALLRKKELLPAEA